MSHQLELAEAAQREGIENVSDHNKAWLERARMIARDICECRGKATIDDVRRLMPPPSHGNAFGAVFKVGFKWNGEWRKSEVRSNHARWVRVWELLP